MIDDKVLNKEKKCASWGQEYEDTFAATFKNEILPLKAKKNFRVTSRDWMVSYQKQDLIENIEENQIFGPYTGELNNITQDGQPVVSSYHFKNFSENKENLKQNDCSLKIQIGPLNKTHYYRTTSSEWFDDFMKNESDIQLCMSKLIEESLTMLDHEAPVSTKSFGVEYKPNPSPNQDKASYQRVESKDNSFLIGYNEKDVLFGRGGRGNHHPGNKKYRALVRSYKKKYKNTRCKQAKTAMAKQITEQINESGGRFLLFNKEIGAWVEVPKLRARTKVSQALRETKD